MNKNEADRSNRNDFSYDADKKFFKQSVKRTYSISILFSKNDYQLQLEISIM